MLVLARKLGESIRIGDDVRVTVVQIRPGRVRLGIEAPRSVRVRREEIPEDDDCTYLEVEVEVATGTW